MGTRLLTYDELRDHGVTYSRRNLYYLERAGKFPRRVAIGPLRVAWIEDEIDAYITARIKGRSYQIGEVGSMNFKRRKVKAE